MTARYATQNEIARWNALILQNPDGGNVFASAEYADIKRLTQYRPRYIIVNESLAVTVLEKRTSPIGALWYLPKGPEVSSVAALHDTLRALRPLAKKAGAFVIRIEPELNRSAEPSIRKLGLIKAAPIIPNASTITLDLSADSETLLLQLPQSGRHAIRRAKRDGVTVQHVAVTPKNAHTMYKLLAETAEGQFGIRSYNYYNSYWRTFEKAGIGRLFFAYYEGVVVAGAYAMVFGEKSTYKDGASIRRRTAYGASHLLQWHVIQWAKEHGSLIHDFAGSPPSEEINNPEHPHYGIGRFKQSFSKQVVDYIGCYDYVISKSRYALWTRGLERLHRHNYYKKTNDYYY